MQETDFLDFQNIVGISKVIVVKLLRGIVTRFYGRLISVDEPRQTLINSVFKIVY